VIYTCAVAAITVDNACTIVSPQKIAMECNGASRGVIVINRPYPDIKYLKLTSVIAFQTSAHVTGAMLPRLESIDLVAYHTRFGAQVTPRKSATNCTYVGALSLQPSVTVTMRRRAASRLSNVTTVCRRIVNKQLIVKEKEIPGKLAHVFSP
jgi:hypothetical protein